MILPKLMILSSVSCILLALTAVNVVGQEEFWIEMKLPERVDVLALAVQHDGTIYAGTHHNGVYVSNNNGVLWSQRNHGLEDKDVRSLAIAPNDHVFAGTSKGVFRSSDKGVNWTGVGLSQYCMSDIAITSAGGVFACGPLATVYRSSDDGTHWTRCDSGFTSLYVYSLAIKSDSILFAGAQTLTTEPEAGVYRSTNDGQSWVRVSEGLFNQEVQSLTVSQNGYIFAGAGQIFDEERGGVFRSTNDGKAWSQVFPLAFRMAIPGSVLVDSSRHIYFIGGGIYRSTDNGETWNEIVSRFPINGNTMAIDSRGYVYLGGTSVYRSVAPTMRKRN